MCYHHHMSLIDQITDYGWAQGFGCIILDDDTRIHLWTPKWPFVDTPFVHSHNYWFESTVLIGTMYAPEFIVKENPDGKSKMVRGTVTKEKMENPIPCDLIKNGLIEVLAGQTYEFGGPDRFHMTHSLNEVMTHFRVLPKGRSKTPSAFLLPPPPFVELTDRPTKEELRTEVIRLLEEHNL